MTDVIEQADLKPPVQDGSALMAAVLAVKQAAPSFHKDRTATVQTQKGNYSYRYADLGSIVEVVEPLLIEQRLVWLTMPGYDQGENVLHYQLTHADSRESIGGSMKLLLGDKITMQGLGSAITYARRYALCAVLGLVADEDDDGNAAATGGYAAAQPSDQGDTVNLQREGKGLRNEAINAALSKAGLSGGEKPWGTLGRIPAQHEDTVREALRLQQEMA